MRKRTAFLSFLLTCLAAGSAGAQQDPTPVELTLKKWGFNNGTVNVTLITDPPIETPDEDVTDGLIEFEFQTPDHKKADPQPKHTGPDGGGVGNEWRFEIKLLEPFRGRLCITAKKWTYADSEPVYVNLQLLPKVVKLESQPPDTGIVMASEIDLPAGVAVTFRLQAHDIATGDLLVLENGRYHLQIEGPGATAFTIDSGHSARTLQLVDGEATFTLTGRPGAEAAWLVGFDADRGPDDPDALSPIRLRLVVR